MKAYMIYEPGGPDKFKMVDIPIPKPRPCWVLIKVRAFGLNRSELLTRCGHSPTVKFPRVLGIECVGEVIEAPECGINRGQTVAAILGGMGREFDGSYAEYVLVPRSQVFPIQTNLQWNTLAALPEMLQTTHGSLYCGLEINRADNLLVRGATSSIGLASIALAKLAGLEITATTRDASKIPDLLRAGAQHTFVDDGEISKKVKSIHPDGFDRILELVGTSTLLDSLQSARRGGIVCMTGMLGGEWILKNFNPMGDVPTGVKLTSYSGDASDISTEKLHQYLRLIEAGKLQIKAGPIFSFDQLKLAHALMDENRANGKIVVEIN